MGDCANCPRRDRRPDFRWVAARRPVPLSGIINLDKPPGITSHDAVNAVRRLSGQRKVGHAGTLDPIASGVLLICLGRATRVAEYLMVGQKRYRATVVLGQTTTTYDIEGEVVDRGGRTDFGRAEIEEALGAFVGRIEQVPPMYSALKHRGQPLYKFARQGQEVERATRVVDIHEIVLVDWTSPTLTIELACSPGTYVRSLAHDLGQRLGSGAFLATLVRLASGRFTLEEAVSLERLEEGFKHGQEHEYLLPIDEALLDLPALILRPEDVHRIVQGQAVREPSLLGERAGGPDGAQDYRAYSPTGEFLAILGYDLDAGEWRPRKVLAEQGTS